MAVVVSWNCHLVPPVSAKSSQPRNRRLFNLPERRHLALAHAHNGGSDCEPNTAEGKEVDNVGVKVALSLLKFYKREISPVLPRSCRYVPTCSEYAMEAYKKYGVFKGTVLTTWRICRCNPLGGSGFDPPRWFGETSLPEE